MDYQDTYQPIMQESTSKQTPNNMATASLVLGILALVTFCCYYTAPIFGGLSILFAILSRPEGRFSRPAKTGIILSVIALVLLLALWAVLIFILMSDIGNETIQNMPAVMPIPEVTEGLDNILTAVWRIPMGGVR